jgi:hypothetical protein
MKYLGYLIILLEIFGTAVLGHKDYSLAKGIQDCAFLITGASLIIIDRLKPVQHKVKDNNDKDGK